MQTTINDVLNAVSVAIDAKHPNMPIFGEEIKQQLSPPGFHIKLLEPSHTHELGRRYSRSHPVVVRYFSDKRENEDMYAMAESLMDILEWITLGGQLLNGTNMYFEIVDEVLHFFVQYNFLVWREQPQVPKMQTLDQEGYIHE